MKTTAVLHTILHYIESWNLKQYTRPNELNIICIRSLESKPNSFDDLTSVICKRTDGDWEFNTFPATTNPGNFWLSHALNRWLNDGFVLYTERITFAAPIFRDVAQPGSALAWGARGR